MICDLNVHYKIRISSDFDLILVWAYTLVTSQFCAGCTYSHNKLFLMIRYCFMIQTEDWVGMRKRVKSMGLIPKVVNIK